MTPPPGTPEAKEQGCTCLPLTSAEVDILTPVGWFSEWCELHGEGG
jgi:hypothetical protein